MSRAVPYPLLTVALVVIWLLLTAFTPGQLLVGIAVALIAGQGMSLLRPAKPRIKRWDVVARLFVLVLYDILRSNYDVARLILSRRSPGRESGFMTIPLEMRDPTGLAVLAIILTSTPGTVWLDYNAARSTLLIHVLDLVDDAVWLDLIKGRYERMLMEIFE